MDNKQIHKKTALIVANGEIKNHKKMKEIIVSNCGEDLYIISVDGGLHNTLKMGFNPHLVIGDMDSISSREKTGLKQKFSAAEFISAGQVKDESDTRLAVEHVLGKGIKNITITGATGGRIDHTLANILILAAPELKSVSIRIINEENEIFCMNSSGTVTGKTGKIISIFSFTPYTRFIKTVGLRYPLIDEKLFQSPVRGLSNIFSSDEVYLEFDKGQLLIIKQL